MIWLSALLLLLHVPDGTEIIINADQITSLRGPAADPAQRMFPHGARCMITMSNGKFHTVSETCAEVRRMMEGAK